MQINQMQVLHLIDQMRELEGNTELIHRLISYGHMKDGKPYICLFEYGDDSDYLNELGLSKENHARVESLLLDLYNSQVDSMILDVYHRGVGKDRFATHAAIKYDVVRLFNQASIDVRVDFTLSTSDDNVSEGPMTDLYYTLGILTIQGV